MQWQSRRAAVALGLALAGRLLAADHPPYLYKVASATAVELTNTIGNDQSDATDVNNLGEIAGWAVAPNGAVHSFLYHTSGAMEDISGLVATLDSYAYGINDFSEIVGAFYHTGHNRPFYWHASTGFTEMSREIYPGNDNNDTDARAINDYHHVVGSTLFQELGDYDGVAVHWQHPLESASMLYHPLAGTAFRATDISNSGWIVGDELTDQDRGYRFRDGGLTYVPDPTGGTTKEIEGVNESGAVVGWAGHASGHPRAIFWSGNTTNSRFLGVLAGGDGSKAYEVNDQNFVVGYSRKAFATSTGSVMRDRAFIWHSEFGMYELPTPFDGRGGGTATNCWANSLNNLKSSHGALIIRVVGYCTRAGKKRAISWNVVIDEYRWFPQ
jgi:hypothetical protein